MADLPISAAVSSDGYVTYTYADGHTVTLHGTHPYRDNNPGNLRYMGRSGLARAKQAGGIGIDNSFAILPDGKAGEDALHAMIRRRAAEGQTLQSFLTIYAPAGENNLASYLVAVGTALKAKPADTLASLSDQQRATLAETIMIQEGWRSRKSMFSPPVVGPPRR